MPIIKRTGAHVHIGMETRNERDERRWQAMNRHPRCENCEGKTTRSCKRCGQRICRRCARSHKRADFTMPDEFWKDCE